MNNTNNDLTETTTMEELKMEELKMKDFKMEELKRAVTSITMPKQTAQDLLEGCLSQNRTASLRFRYPKWIAAALAIVLFTAVGTTSVMP